LRLYADLQDLLMSRIVWFIRNAPLRSESLDTIVTAYRNGIGAVADSLDGTLGPAARENVARRTAALIDAGAPADVAARFARLPALAGAPDIVLVAQRTGRPVEEIARTYFAVDEAFQLGALAGAAREVAAVDHYDRLALDRAVDGIASAHRRLTGEAAAHGVGAAAVDAWRAQRGAEATRIREAVDDIVASGLTVSKLTVASSLLVDLARG
jgi:glutamate dehydrogenase